MLLTLKTRYKSIYRSYCQRLISNLFEIILMDSKQQDRGSTVTFAQAVLLASSPSMTGIRKWCRETHIGWRLSAPGKPMQKASAERFPGRSRDALLNAAIRSPWRDRGIARTEVSAVNGNVGQPLRAKRVALPGGARPTPHFGCHRREFIPERIAPFRPSIRRRFYDGGKDTPGRLAHSSRKGPRSPDRHCAVRRRPEPRWQDRRRRCGPCR